LTVTNHVETVLGSGQIADEAGQQQWIDSEAAEIREQTETFAMLKRAMSENRAPEFRHFEISEDGTMAAAMNSPATASNETLSFEERRRRRLDFSRPAIALLQSWLEDDEDSEDEQRIGLEELKRAIDSHRPPGQKVFSV
jgi:hypothetical protein